MCETKRSRERESECVCVRERVSVCVCERERVSECVCACVCVRERDGANGRCTVVIEELWITCFQSE